MSEPSNQRTSVTARKRKTENRVFDSDTAALQSLRLIAAPRPEDDLTEDQMIAFCQEKRYSSEMIHNLINFVKSI